MAFLKYVYLPIKGSVMTPTSYFPPAGHVWQTASDAPVDQIRLAAAVDFAKQHDSPMNRDIRQALEAGHFSEPPPINEIIGPVKPRQEPSGMILHKGQIIAKWGDIDRVDMTFSATKSYLSLCAGLAVDRGIIPDIDAPVRDLVDDGGFEAPQNHTITWRHLLQLTSEWQGTLWDKPDSIDHNRSLAAAAGSDARKGEPREMQRPGSFWEYNDVRVNRLALALLRVWRRPLPAVLRDHIMDPIGASDGWQWHGYSNSYVDIDGQSMQSVSGGAHWGGGLWISSRDHARVGLLMANRGNWNGQQLISETWIKQSLTPAALNPSYGLMWWLNTTGEQAPSAPKNSFFARGVGANMIWVAPEQDLVAVVRWIDRDAFDGFTAAVMAALR